MVVGWDLCWHALLQVKTAYAVQGQSATPCTHSRCVVWCCMVWCQLVMRLVYTMLLHACCCPPQYLCTAPTTVAEPYRTMGSAAFYSPCGSAAHSGVGAPKPARPVHPGSSCPCVQESCTTGRRQGQSSSCSRETDGGRAVQSPGAGAPSASCGTAATAADAATPAAVAAA